MHTSPATMSDVPRDDPTKIGSSGTGDIGTIPPLPPTPSTPSKWVSYRITSDNRDEVIECFDGCNCVIADEISSKGIRHFHVVVEGYEHYETVKKRIQRLKLGRAKYWSEKNSGTFLGAVAYTIKDGDYYSRGFKKWIEAAENYVPHRSEPLPFADRKDTETDWMLSYNSVLRVAFNYRRSRQLSTSDLGAVLRHMTSHTRWIPSPQMLKSGLDPWHFKMFTYRCHQEAGQMPEVPDWWTPHVDWRETGLYGYHNPNAV